ncbi:hypothetical protein BC628DRAFT_869704 [Trametes gibbosa]|nr:hypothetical protein BC628DRAFT_869704 [Trametes gibbosa]
MFLSGLYIHPRPPMFYKPRSRTSPQPSPTSVRSPHSPVIREQAIQEALDAEFHLRRPDFGCIVDKQRSFTMRVPKESYNTENVAEALRVKQRTRARQALKNVSLGNETTPHELPELVLSYPSCVSSPANLPPPTPRLLPIDLSCTQKSPDLVALEATSSQVQRDQNHQSVFEEDYTREAMPRGDTSKRSHRPSQSHSSLLHRSLPQKLSRDSMSSPSPPATGNASSFIVDIIRRLPPLPRFDPHRRARAESTSSVTFSGRHELNGRLCGLVPRRRCKSEPSQVCVRLKQISQMK